MKKSDLELQNLKDCINSLKECESSLKADNIDVKMKNFIEDACIKRYEFTVETAWKTMKKYLKSEYGKSDKELTMNNIFRLMEGYNLMGLVVVDAANKTKSSSDGGQQKTAAKTE